MIYISNRGNSQYEIRIRRKTYDKVNLVTFSMNEFNFWTNFGNFRPQCSGNGSVRWSWGLQRTLSHMNESFTKYPTVVSGTIIKIMLDKDFYQFEDKEITKIFNGFWTRNYQSEECYSDASYFATTAAFDGCGGFSEPHLI